MMTVKDPVCGMMIEEEKSAGTSTYEGKTYYFCSADCKAAFDEEPHKFADHGDMEAHSHHKNH